MALTSSAPITVGGNVYDKYALTLSVSKVNQGGNMGAAVVMVLTPYRYDAVGNVDALEGHDISLIVSDADIKAMEDGDFALAIGTVLAGIQGYVDAKGI